MAKSQPLNEGGSSAAGGPTRPVARPKMQRGVSQLLFNYLPGRTVDWEDGLAIVRLGAVRLGAAWEPQRMAAVLEEVSGLLDRWRSRGGTVDSRFPNPREAGRFTIGAPEAIEASYLETALVCARCSRLVFVKASQLVSSAGRRCPACGAPRLRQIPHVFVHGCGELVPGTGMAARDEEESGRINRSRQSSASLPAMWTGWRAVPSFAQRAGEGHVRGLSQVQHSSHRSLHGSLSSLCQGHREGDGRRIVAICVSGPA